jgi:hypothetical protein
VVAAALPLVVEVRPATDEQRVGGSVHHHTVPRRRAPRDQLGAGAGRHDVGAPPAVAVARAVELDLDRAVGVLVEVGDPQQPDVLRLVPEGREAVELGPVVRRAGGRGARPPRVVVGLVRGQRWGAWVAAKPSGPWWRRWRSGSFKLALYRVRAPNLYHTSQC